MQAAFLEFLATAAKTRIITPDLWFTSYDRRWWTIVCPECQPVGVDFPDIGRDRVFQFLNLLFITMFVRIEVLFFCERRDGCE